jgi:hypothetical protein
MTSGEPIVRPGPVAAPTLAVVIVAYETPELLRACLASLERAGVLGRDPVVIVDNSATAGSAAVAAATAGVTLIRNPKNVGYARAVNQGLAATSTDYVLVLNPDIEVEVDSIERLVQAMEDNPACGLAGAKLLNPDRSLQHSCRRFYTPGTILLRRTFLGRLRPGHRVLREHLMLDWDHATRRDVDWLIGACLLVRRRAVADVGPMDERFFLYFEDVDWCARMHLRGWRVLYVPDAVMVHHHRRESARGGLLHPSRRMHLASVLRFYEKWSLFLYLLKRNRERVRGLVLAGCDLAALNAAFLVAFGVRKLLSTQFAKPLFTVADYWQFLLVFNLATLVALRRYGLYRPGRALTQSDLVRRVTQSVFLAALAVLVSTFLLYIRAYSRFVIGLTVPLAIMAITGARLLLGRFLDRLAREGLAARRVLLVGDPGLAAWMAERLAQARRPRFEIVAALDETSHLLADPEQARARLSDLCHRERVHEVIVADRDGSLAALVGALAPLAREGLGIRLLGPWSRVLPPGARIEETAGVELVVPPAAAGGGPG